MSFNYLAIVSASVVSVFLGTVYGLVFRKFAFNLGEVPPGGKVRQVSRFREYSGSILLDIAIALGLSYLILGLGIHSFIQDLELTFWVFLGFVMPLTLSAVLRKNITFQYWLFNAVINIFCLFIMIMILTFWR